MVSRGPDASSASSVLAKVGGAGLPAMAATSARFSAIAASSAGMKCSVRISVERRRAAVRAGPFGEDGIVGKGGLFHALTPGCESREP